MRGNQDSIDLTGKQVDSLICLADSHTVYIQCKCVECNLVQEKERATFKRLFLGLAMHNGSRHITCKNTLCKYHSFRESKSLTNTNKQGKQNIVEKTDKYAVGTVHGSLKIISKIDVNTVKVHCIYCDYSNTISVRQLRRYNFCRNKDCKGANNTVYNIGDIYNNLQVLSYNTRYYKVRCIKCMQEFETESYAFMDNKKHCKNINCSEYCRAYEQEYLVGLTKHNLKGLRYVLDNNRRCIETQCIICGKKSIRSLTHFLSGQICCDNKNCTNGKYGSIENIYGDFKIIEITEDNKYIAECIICKHKISSEKLLSPKACCKYHPHAHKKFEGLFNNFRIEANAYTYKEDDYFICSCTKCGYRDILTAAEMLQHKCEERN